MNDSNDIRNGNVEITAETLDQSHEPFVGSSAWAALSFDKEKWIRNTLLIARPDETDLEFLRQARRVATRAAAVDTGAIEGLYDVNEGFTITFAAGVGAWESAFGADKKRRNLIESQLAAYDMVLDFATGTAPIVEAWIRELHSALCEAQGTYQIKDSLGRIEDRPLPIGEYKKQPNHVLDRNGRLHSYCPVDLVSVEMTRFVKQLNSAEFKAMHPAIQAAYAHYAFVSIHPFADGNGRVARALASIFLYRAASIPLMVLLENRSQYLEALADTDQGSFQGMVSFVEARVTETCMLIGESMRAARAPDPELLGKRLGRLYMSDAGYTYEVIDTASSGLLQLLSKTVTDRISEALIDVRPVVKATILHSTSEPPPNYRHPVNPKHGTLLVDIELPPPASANLRLEFYAWVPVNPEMDSAVLIKSSASDELLAVPLNNLIPSVKTIAGLQTKIFAEGPIGFALDRLTRAARQTLHKAGYLPDKSD